MKIKTAALIGPALDWAVAKAWQPVYSDKHVVANTKGYSPSTDWSYGGPRIASGKINIKSNLTRTPEHPEYDWLADCPERGICVSFTGPTPLIAAMRCYVASKLGCEVEIPSELMPSCAAL